MQLFGLPLCFRVSFALVGGVAGLEVSGAGFLAFLLWGGGFGFGGFRGDGGGNDDHEVEEEEGKGGGASVDDDGGQR